MVADKKQKPAKKSADMLKLIKTNAESVANVEQEKPGADPVTEENVLKFIKGEMTWAQVQGINMEQAYEMAEIGYQLFLQGKNKEAATIFEGLIVLNPYDGYFHSVLGSIWARSDQSDKAIGEYSIAINLSPKDPQVLVNRAELLLKKGKFEDGLKDLRKAIDLDPEGTNSPAVHRAKALAKATGALIDEILQGKKGDKAKAAKPAAKTAAKPKAKPKK